MKFGVLLTFVFLILAFSLILTIILPVKICCIPLWVSVLVLSVLLSLIFISISFKEKYIVFSEKILDLEMPNSNVRLIKIDGELKEIKIGDDSYSNICCKTENPVSLKVLKDKIEERWKFIYFNRKEQYTVVLE